MHFFATGLLNGETIGSVTLTSAGAINTANAGIYPIVSSAATGGTFTASNYAITYTSGTLTVGTAPLTITADDQNKTYGTTLALGTSAFSATGLQNGETIGSVTLTSAGAINTANAGVYPIVSSAATGGTFTAANYTITYVDGALTVTKAILTVTANDQTKVYGAVNPVLTITYSGFVASDNAASLTTQPTASTTAITSSPAGAYPITASGGVSNNYTFTYVAGTLTITKAVLTVTANDQTKVYGAVNPALTITYSGFVGSDNAASLTTQPTASTTAITSSPVGAYPITASGGVSNNYTFTYVAGTLTVTKAVLTVTANNQTKVYGAVNPALTITYSGFVGSDNAASLTTQPTASTTAITSSPAGAYPITASGGVSNNYTFTYVAGTLTVTPAVLTVTANDQTKVYGAVNPALTITYGGFVGSDNAASLTTQPTASTTAITSSPAGAYPITVSGGVSNNYTFTYVAGTLTITKAVLTVTANNQTKVYGAVNPALTINYSGFVGSDNAASLTTPPTASTTAITSSPVGAYPITASGGVSNNYTFTYVAGTLTITKAVLTVTATNQTKVYGAANPALPITYSGFVGSDNAASLITQPTATTTATVASPVGTYPITASGGVSNNYTFTYVAGTLTITTASTTISVTSNNTPSCFGASVTFTATVTSILSNATGQVQFLDGATSLGTVAMSGNTATLSISTLTVGSHSITVKYLGDVNYTTSTSVVFTQVVNPATPAPPTATAGTGAACSQITANWNASANATAYFLDVSTVNTFASFVGSYNNLNVGNVTTLNVTGLNPGTTYFYRVRANNSCGTSLSSATITYATLPSTPSTPGGISGTIAQCPALTSQVYSVSSVANATTYTWTLPAGWLITAGAGTNSITVTTGAAGQNGNITVTAGNSCGTSVASTLAVTVNPGTPANPGTITGSGTVCPSISLTYSITAVANATVYTWTVPAGWTITAGQGSISITVTTGATGQNGTISVTAGNSCGTSSGSQTINITPLNGTNNTGYTNGGSKTSGTINVNNSGSQLRGYIKFPLTAIPAGSTITSSVLKLTNNGSLTSGATNDVKPLSLDPVSATAANIYNGIGAQGSGANYSSTTWSNSGTISLTLGGTANADIQSAIPTGYIAMGLARGGTANYIFDGYAGANPPVLIVVYNITGGNLSVTVSPGTPVAPVTKAGTGAACSGITANWNASTNATAYFLDVSTSNTFGTFVSGYNNLNVGNVLTYNVTGLTAGITYFYRVRATNSCGTSTSSSVITYATLPAAPAPPGVISGDPTQCPAQTGQVYSIAAVANATTYNWALPAGWSITSGTGTVSITVTSGTAGQNGNITVTAGNSCGTSAAGTPLAVIVNAKPVANAITGANAVCIGSTITLSPNATGAAPFSYSWSSSNTTVATITSAGVVLGKAVGSTLITYVVTDANGCSQTSASFTVNVTKPTANAITQASGISVICVASPLTLTSNATGTGTLSYSWTSSNNSIATVTATTGIVTGIAAGTVSITYTVTDGNGCQTTSPAYSITVNPIPTGSFTSAETSGAVNNDNIICTGGTVTFTAPSGYGSYIFKVNGITAQTGTNNVFSSFTLANNASVTVDVANSSNCGTTFGPIVITVNALPTPSLVADKTIICPGDLITFTAGGGINYVFKLNGSSVQSSASATYSSSSLNNGDSVTVDVKNASGCTSTSVAVYITVKPVPTGILTASATTICQNDAVIFSATSGFSTYEFKVNGTTVQGPLATNTYSSSTLTNAQVVTVIVTNSSGCSTTFAGVVITVNLLPTGGLTATENSGTPNDNSICAGAAVTFTFNTGYSNYNFKVNNVSKQSGTSNTYTNNILASGDIVTAEVTSGSGCKATFTAPAITITSSPAGTLSVSPATICEGSNVTFTATSGYNNYNFSVNNSSAQNGSANTFSSTGFVNGDIVTVDVTNVNSCITTFNSITLVVNALPTGTLVPVENSGNTPNDGIICTGATVIFTAPTGFTNYDFLLNGATIQSGASNTYSNSALINDDRLQVAVTNASGCIGLLNTDTITVNPLPAVAPITGTFNVCVNSTTTLTDATISGVWASSNSAIATIDASGVLTGVAAGTVTITYTFTNANGCSNTVNAIATINALLAVTPITGNVNVCTGTSSQLNNATAGGIWNSSNTAIATVNSLGLVDGISAGTATISYTVTNTNGCTTIVTADVTVNDLPVVAPITGTFNVCVSSSTTLADVTSGGTWSSSNTAVATVNASGVVTGLTNGTSIISYSITTSCLQTQSASATITVTAIPSATISYSGSPFCTSSAPATVSQTGTPAGTYSSTGGLTINSADGTITPATSTGGTYTVTYTVAASGGCGVYTTTTQVTITTAPSATISYGGPYCTSSAPANVTRTGTPGGTYSSSAGLTINGITGTITPATSTNGTYTITYTIAASGGCALFTTTTSVTITAAPSATISYTGSPFCTSSGTVNVNLTGTPGGTYSFAPAGLTINASNGTITPATSSGRTYTVTYTVTGSGGCSTFTTTTTLIITPAPSALAGTAIVTCANSGAVNITAGSGASNQSSILWTSSGTGTISNSNSLTTATYTPSAADISAGIITLTLTASGNGGCTAVTSSKTVTISALPAAPTITPPSAVICQGSIQPLSSGTASSTTNLTLNSGIINLAMPDYNIIGAANAITVSGIPAGAVINTVSVNFNITHPYDGDLIINLKAPNLSVINLVDLRGGSGQNFTNTTVSSAGGLIFTTSSLAAPFTGTYRADADFPVLGASSGGGNTPNTTVFNSLFGTPNGNWVFSGVDLGSGDVGSINSWSITINYTVAAVSQPVVWSPITDLYTDAGATIPYASQSLAIVYAKPATSGSKVYTATSTGATCNNAANVTLTVNPAPSVTITADYCAVAGKVHLTANSVPAASGYTWSTGAITQSIDVDIAAIYKVTVSMGSGCSGSATIGVAQELVVNGDFTNGNTGFTSDYTYYPDLPAYNQELVPDDGTKGYGVGTDGQNYHPYFFGQDHTNNTTGSRKFMLVNGHGTSLIVWKETVNVLPNTTYYFSAWAMSLNDAGPFAKLQFNVNGTLVGSTAILAKGPTSGPINGWVRFYGNWTSGPAVTSANIQINDLQPSAPGNDFGLDDISFGTLSTFVSIESGPATDEQNPCVNTPITPIVYSVGSTASGPTITGLPLGVTTSFNGELLTISGTPTVAGNYSYTVTTTGTCNPASATGTITVQSQTITLTSGSAAPVCINTSIPSIVYTLGGTATGATATGLPAGITGAATSGNTFTISGTPTVAGIYSYSITTSGTCTPVTMTGAITVQSQTITLNTANASQTVCLNAPIANIQYTVGGTGTNASVSGLPPGVSGNFSGGLFIISGSPVSAAGSPYNYTVTTTGTCSPVTATGTITVTPAASISLASGTNPQTVCKGVPITNITYSVTNATSASVSGLPSGINGVLNSGIFTISGTPSVNGIFNYTITASGSCAPGTATGTITVQTQTISLTTGTASPSVCINTLMTNIVYTIGGTATAAILTGQPAGITGSLSGNVFTISGTPTGPAGAFAYTITTSGGCGQATASGTINVLAAPAGGTLASFIVCSGSSGNITVSGSTPGAIQRWESSTDGVTWIPIANTTITQSYTNVTQPIMYRVVVSSSGCNVGYSTIALVSIHNLWTGITNTDWNTATNWSGNALPSMACPDVYIPNTPNQPILSGFPIATINNLHILPGAILTVNGSGTLQIAGTISSSGIFDASSGTIEFNGTSLQTIIAGTFQGNAINDLVVTNTAGVTLGGATDVYRSLTYGISNAKLNTGGFLTLKSTISQTAWIGDMTGHTINGDVTVERYIATGSTHAKSWQLLATPTTGQTIKESWQEGATAVTGLPPYPNAGNPNPGFGTMLTSNEPNAQIQPPLGPGFDAFTSPGPSIKVYNSATDAYVGPLSTGIPIYNQKGYFILVRGDRSVYTFNAPAVPTVLRTKGTLFTPANLPPSTTVLPNTFESVGNPYASSIDVRNVSLTAGINSTIIVWDPTLGIGSAYGLGAYQTLYLNGDGTNDGNNDYVNLLPSIAYGAAGTSHNTIQSGQAFLIQALPALGGTLSFSESAKASGSNALMLRPERLPNERQAQLGLNLYGVNASGTYLTDGALIQYNDNYSDSIDGMDVRKMANVNENLAIKTATKLLAIERKLSISKQDTIFLNLAGVRAQAYNFEFIASNLDDGLVGFLEDNYLHTRTPLDLKGTTLANFTIVNISGSYAPDRFRIVFASPVVLPVTFTSVKAYLHDKNIDIEWKVENEMNMKQYEVEKSTNGTQFTTLAVKAATANGGHSAIYVTADANPVEGYNYYRVKSVDINGKTAYTNVVKVLIGSIKQDIIIYPNPITDGKIHLKLMNEPGGSYGIRLLNKIGQVIVSMKISHAEGSSTEIINWDYNLAHGMYQLEITKPDGGIKVINVMY